jgi:lipid-binding SYLF domain-containing protein
MELFGACGVIRAHLPQKEFPMLKYLAQAVGAMALIAGLAAAPARADDMADLLHDANTTVDNLKHDPSFATARSMLQTARAVYIVPKLVKGGFIFGAEGGDGVLLRRNGRGWSAPRFYSMGSASFGLQAGLQQAQLVFIINSDRALSGIEHGNFKIGGQGGVTVANLSAGAEGATTLHGGDMVVWTSGTGAYAGLTFNGTVIRPDKDLNARPATGPAAQRLRANLNSIW